MGKTSQCAQYHEQILELTRQGLGRHTIARQIGVSHPALSMYMARRGLHSAGMRGPGIRIDRDEIRRLVLVEGLTQPQIAERLGCCRSAIERASKKMGLQTARTGPRSGASHPGWKGGRVVENCGYVGVHAPLHPLARKPTGRVAEHRLVMEVVLGRYLLPGEVVDHRDDHPRHNWPDNLQLYTSNADHLKATLTGREKASPRSSIVGAYGNNQKTDRCPGPHETLALCPKTIRLAVERHIEIHRPGTEHAHLPRSILLRSGARHPPFQDMSTA